MWLYLHKKPRLSVTDTVVAVIEGQEAAEPDCVSAGVCDSPYKRQAAAAYLYTSSPQMAILKTLKAFRSHISKHISKNAILALLGSPSCHCTQLLLQR